MHMQRLLHLPAIKIVADQLAYILTSRHHSNEVMKQMKEEEREEEEEKESREEQVWDCGSPLYDSYELAALGHLIDRHTMALPSPCGSYRFSFRVEKRVKTASFQGVTGAWWRWRRKQVRSGGKDKSKKKKEVKSGLFGFSTVGLCLKAQPVRPM